jgi:pSer/pThr/pTyr-binding forkhead associated (FHA) protein
MVKRLLVIDRDDQGEFFLSVDAGVMTIGGNSKNAEAVLRDLHISRIHCEVEVDEDLLVVSNPVTGTSQQTGGAPHRRELHPGEALHIGHSHLSFKGDAVTPTSPGTTVPESNVLRDFSDEMLVEDAKPPAEDSAPPAESHATAGQPQLLKRLLVIDGADKGRSYSLPDAGKTTIGQSKKAADIVLHDLFVSRIHCELEIEDDHVFVTHLHGDNGTLINGQKITEQELRISDVIRVGNSQLRFEIIPIEDSSADEDEEDEETIEVLPADDEEAYEVEVVEEESEVSESIEEATADITDPYALPHAAVDQLLKLENQVLGHYQIGPLLGRGQTSLVFRALDTKNQQLVSLKVISPDFPSEDAELQRFMKALKVLLPLQNPYLLTLCGAGKTSHYCWIAREYIEGESLARLIQRLAAGGRLDWTRACRVGIHLGKALDFLQKHRVCHGNITPRNLLIRKSDRVTKLADLMLNRALEGSRLQKAILGKKLLTELPYLAPEQTDPHAPGSSLGDLYSVGTVLYALLTGQPPFTGSSPREVLARIREGKVVRPSKVQRGIPAPFEAAVLLMMARRPEDRFQTAAEMLDAVQRVADENEIEV